MVGSSWGHTKTPVQQRKQRFTKWPPCRSRECAREIGCKDELQDRREEIKSERWLGEGRRHVQRSAAMSTNQNDIARLLVLFGEERCAVLAALAAAVTAASAVNTLDIV